MTTSPDTSDNFEVIKKVGNGVFGAVYHVREPSPPYREFALKEIFDCYDSNKINNEIKALELLNKFHLGLHFYSAQKRPDKVSLLLEYSPANNLIRHVRNNGALTEVQMAKLLTDMLEMLKFMENHTLLHLDIKPTNILCHKEKYILIDWGLCKWGNSARTIRLNGNPIYFPPEMYFGKRNIASEVYSLGCVLYFALTGKEVFNLDYHMPLCQKIYSHTFLSPEFPVNVSNKFQYLISRMIEKDPRKRITIPEIEKVLQEDKNYELQKYRPEKTIDFSDEITIYQLLAKEKVPYAQNLLSKYYQRGEAVEQNYKIAFNLNSSAAQFNLAKAQFDLAIAYRDGKGVNPDVNRAFDLFSKAARQGHEHSQYALARMFDQGVGTSSVKTVAQYWYQQATMNGHKKARGKLKNLTKHESI